MSRSSFVEWVDRGRSSFGTDGVVSHFEGVASDTVTPTDQFTSSIVGCLAIHNRSEPRSHHIGRYFGHLCWIWGHFGFSKKSYPLDRWLDTTSGVEDLEILVHCEFGSFWGYYPSHIGYSSCDLRPEKRLLPQLLSSFS